MTSTSKLQSPQAHSVHRSCGQTGLTNAKCAYSPALRLSQWSHLAVFTDHFKSELWQPSLNSQPMITDFTNHIHIALPNFTETTLNQGPNLAIHLPAELELGLKPTGEKYTAADGLIR